MRTASDRMDAILAQLTPRELPEFRRAIDLFERCGSIPHAEVEEWRRRLAAWVAFRSARTKATRPVRCPLGGQPKPAINRGGPRR